MAETQHQYKCPCCGGEIEFNSSIQKMSCPYCDTEFEMEALKQYDAALNDTIAEDMTWQTAAGQEWEDGELDGMKVFSCNSCGGEIVGDENTGATSCPYCGNPTVFMGTFSGDLKPDYVIPFQLNKNAAKDKLREHMKGKKLLPKAFIAENHIDEVKGVYVPFWLFDADVRANIQYRATRVRTWSDSEYDYEEISHYLVTRDGDVAFENVPVDGSTQMPDDLMESIEPFDFRKATDFQTAYLSGYLADKYDVTAEQSIGRANQRVKQSTEDAFAETVTGYSTVTPSSTNIQIQNGQAKYAMYPVWLLNTSWNNEKFLFAMNGQTGKFVGNLPCDKGAFGRYFAIWFVIGAVIGWFLTSWIFL